MKKSKLSIIILSMLVLTLILIGSRDVDAKTYKSIPDGGYICNYKKAKIKDGRLVIKGTVNNWERAEETAPYEKSGKHKLKLSKKCEILDGYKPSETISKKKFNKLCKKKDESHQTIAFVVTNKKVTLIRFW